MADQAEFDFLIPVSRPLLRMDEVRKCLRLEKDSIYALVEEGKLEAHQDGANKTYRVTRRSVLAYLLATALYHPADWCRIVADLATALPPQAKAKLKSEL